MLMELIETNAMSFEISLVDIVSTEIPLVE